MKSIFVIGDSISIQYGPYLKQYIEGQFAYERLTGEEEALKNLDVPSGANGGDTSRVKGLIEGFVNSGSFHTDFLLINAGLHDIKRHAETNEISINLDQYRENLLAITRQAIDLCGTLIWITTTDVDDEMHARSSWFSRRHEDLIAYNQVAHEVMTEQCIPMLDIYTFTRNLGEGEAIFCDHVHYHDSIRQLQAAYIAGWLSTFTQKD